MQNLELLHRHMFCGLFWEHIFLVQALLVIYPDINLSPTRLVFVLVVCDVDI
jgi:hypothetical protein